MPHHRAGLKLAANFKGGEREPKVISSCYRQIRDIHITVFIIGNAKVVNISLQNTQNIGTVTVHLSI